MTVLCLFGHVYMTTTSTWQAACFKYFVALSLQSKFMHFSAHCVYMNTCCRADVCCLKLIVTAAHRLQWCWKTEQRITDYFFAIKAQNRHWEDKKYLWNIGPHKIYFIYKAERLRANWKVFKNYGIIIILNTTYTVVSCHLCVVGGHIAKVVLHNFPEICTVSIEFYVTISKSVLRVDSNVKTFLRDYFMCSGIIYIRVLLFYA